MSGTNLTFRVSSDSHRHYPVSLTLFCCTCTATGISSMPRRRRLWWSTTSSWRHIWPTESSCLTAFPPRVLRQTRESSGNLSIVATSQCLNVARHSRGISPRSPQSLLAGMNRFLSLLEITFRRDPNNFRPRINKLNSIKVPTLQIRSPLVPSCCG